MKIKKAILTGGGRATRLHPVTTTINKHLLPLANKPMIFHAIEKAVAAGVTEIFINTNPGETELPQYIGDGGHWGIKIKFFEQTGGPQGIAHVVNVLCSGSRPRQPQPAETALTPALSPCSKTSIFSTLAPGLN